MPTLVTIWSVLLLVATCEIEHAHSVDQLDVGLNIEIGAPPAIISAVAKLSTGDNQQAWWKLAEAAWHDSAIQRFFEKGPLRAADMEKLAKVNGQSADTWGASQVANVSSSLSHLMLAVQQLSAINYTMNRTIQGTGQIEASLWTLLFRCIGSASCNEGYFVPMIFVPSSSTKIDQKPGDPYSYQDASLRSLWLPLHSSLLVNAIPSSIGNLRRRAMRVTDVGDPELSIKVSVHDDVSGCLPTTASILNYRSLLDASYGLVPGFSCIEFGSASEPDAFKLLVSRILFFNNATEPRDQSLGAIEDLFSDLQVKASQWRHLPFESCSEEGLLITSSQGPIKSLQLCYNKTCVTSDVANATCRADGVQHLTFLRSIATLSRSCTNNGGKPLEHPSNDTVVSCPIGSTNEVCNATVNVLDIDSAYNVNTLRLLSPKSNWASTQGINTSEFSQAPNMTDFNAFCIRTPNPNSRPFFISSTTEAAFLQDMQVRGRASLKSFITQHNIAFMTTKGPAIDSRSFLALIVSTVIGVILAIAGPFPNFLLRIICRRWPLHLDSQHGRESKVVTVLFGMVCNVLLSFSSFLPVSFMAWNEVDREKSFYTWDLASDDRTIYDSSGSATQLRVVYLICATSKYHSMFILASTLVVCITCIFAGVCCAKRFKDVFERYSILREYDLISQANNLSPVNLRLANRPERLLVIRALKAIDMTDAEYEDMRARVAIHARKQELARLIREAFVTQTAAGRYNFLR